MSDATLPPQIDAAMVLARAIREHRDEKYPAGQVVDDGHDLHLYSALVWFETEYDGAIDSDGMGV